MIRLRFTRDAGFTPWVIRSYTWCDWDHVEVALPDGRYLGARPAGGVMVRANNYKGPLAQAFGDILANDTETKQIMDFLYAQCGKPYDWTAILGIASHRDWRQSDSWICSELIAAAVESTSVRLFNGANANRFSPRDIYINALVHLAP